MEKEAYYVNICVVENLLFSMQFTHTIGLVVYQGRKVAFKFLSIGAQ